MRITEILHAKSENIIHFFEKPRFNILTLVIWLSIISVIRIFFEIYLFFNHPISNILNYDFVFNYLHMIMFTFTVGLAGITILKYLSKESIIKIVNMSALGGALGVIPPILDTLIFRNSQPYKYIPVEQFTDTVFSFWTNLEGQTGGFGEFIQFMLILFLTSLYIYIKTKSIKKSIVNFFLFYLLFITISTPGLFPFFAPFYRFGEFSQPMLLIRYLFISIIIAMILLRITKKGFLATYLKSIKPLLLPIFLICAIGGIFLSSQIKIDIFDIYGIDQIFNITAFLLSLFIIFFLYQYIALLYNTYGLKGKGDKESYNSKGIVDKYISIRQAKHLSIILAVASISLSVSLNIQIVAITSIIILLGVFYFILLNEKKRKKMLPFLFSRGTTLSFTLGYFIPSFKIDYSIINSSIVHEFYRNTSEVNFTLLSSILIIFVLTLIMTYYFFPNSKKDNTIKKV